MARLRTPHLDGDAGISASDTDDLRLTSKWRSMLREERIRTELTQAEVARLVSISTVALRKYEGATRTPSREVLARILVALQVPHDRARRILEDAGYAPVGRMTPVAHPKFHFAIEDARIEIEKVHWPRFVANNAMEVVAMNRAIQDLARFDLESEAGKRRRPQLHFLSLVAEDWFREHVTNMNEVIGMLIGVLKGMPRGGGRLERPNPVVKAVLDQFSASFPGGLARLLEMWETIPPMDSKVQWTYPLVWDEPGVGPIRFHCMVSDAGETDALAFNDWIPADAQSHARLERVLELRRR